MNKLWWVIIGLAAVIVLMILFDRDPEPQGTTVWKNTVSKVEGQLLDSGLRIQSILKEKKADSIKHLQVQSVLKSEANASKAEADRFKRNPIVIKVREEVPEVDSLIIAQDSVIHIQGEQIAELDSAYNKLQVNMEAVLLNFEGQIKLNEQRFEAQKQITAVVEKDLKKARRQSKFAKVLIPIVGVGALLLGAQL